MAVLRHWFVVQSEVHLLSALEALLLVGIVVDRGIELGPQFGGPFLPGCIVQQLVADGFSAAGGVDRCAVPCLASPGGLLLPVAVPSI